MKQDIIVFLDLDGVVIIPSAIHMREIASTDAVDVLNKLTQDYSVNIVFTSTWRINRSARQLKAILTRDYEAQFSDEIKFLDCTEHFPQGSRIDEIKDWLKNDMSTYFQEKVPHVIIDDGLIPSVNFVNCFFLTGLTDSHYDEIVGKINNQLEK